MRIIFLIGAFVFQPYLQSATIYNYDQISRLIKATYDNGTSISYYYDAAGIRLTQTEGVFLPE